MLYEVSNRGGKGMLGFFNHAAGSLDPATPADMGDGFLMAQGFTLLWVGWQFDPPRRQGWSASIRRRRSRATRRSAAWSQRLRRHRASPIIRSPIAITPPTPSSIRARPTTC